MELLGKKDENGRLALHEALLGAGLEGDTELMDVLINAYTSQKLTELLHARDRDGETPLAKAVKSNNVHKVQCWLSHPTMQGSWIDNDQAIMRKSPSLTLSPLCFAIDLTIAQLLIDAGANPRFGSYGHTPLDYARSRQNKYPQLWALMVGRA